MNGLAARLLNILLVLATAAVCGLFAYYACARWLWPSEAIIAAIGVALSVAAVMAVFLFLRGE